MKVVSALVGLVLGGICGFGAALAAAGILGSGVQLGGNVEKDGWSSDWTIGSEAANPWTRARIARHGLLALTKEEAVYFARRTDEAGDRLTEGCTYRVSGGAMPGEWWSVTLYDATSYLPDNGDDALSYDLTNAERDGATEAWAFTVSGAAPSAGGWVSSRAAGAFDLTLRIYRPSAQLLDDPENTLAPPRVEKLSCKEAE